MNMDLRKDIAGIGMENKEYCCTCKWYAEFEGVCTNGESEFRADFRCLDDTCDCWTSREDKPCEKKI